LTEIAQMVGCNTAEEFIAAVTTLSERVGIPATAEKLNTKDFDLIVERAVAEGFGYGSPHLMTAEECHGILNKLLPQ
jgi:alcohol dehydrogenase class IV